MLECYLDESVLPTSCGQIGLFLKGLGDIISYKIAKYLGTNFAVF